MNIACILCNIKGYQAHAVKRHNQIAEYATCIKQFSNFSQTVFLKRARVFNGNREFVNIRDESIIGILVQSSVAAIRVYNFNFDRIQKIKSWSEEFNVGKLLQINVGSASTYRAYQIICMYLPTTKHAYNHTTPHQHYISFLISLSLFLASEN